MIKISQNITQGAKYSKEITKITASSAREKSHTQSLLSVVCSPLTQKKDAIFQ